MIIVFLSGVAVTMSCSTDDISCQRVSSKMVKVDKDLSGFDGVVFTAVGDVVLTEGKDFGFSLQGPENVVEALNTEIVGSDLLISSNACFNGFTGNNQLIVNITAPSFRKLEMSGTGNMRSANTLTGNYLEISFLGVGTMEADLEADSIHTETAGSGKVRLTGVTGVHDLLQAGEVAVDAAGLETDTTRIVQRSSEDTRIFVNSYLHATLEAKGDVYYKGSPAIQSELSGTGQLIPLDN